MLYYQLSPCVRFTPIDLQSFNAHLEVCEGDVPVCRVVRVGAGHQQRVVFLQAADVLAVVRVGGGSVHVRGVERGLVRPVVVDVDAVQSEPVLSC